MIDAYFVLNGRIARWRYVVYWVFLWIIVPVLALLCIPLVENARYPVLASVLAVIGLALFWIWAGLALAVKRLHDLDRTGWHYVWMFLIPGLLTGSIYINWSGTFHAAWSIGFGESVGIVPLLATLYLLLARGSVGPNRFGYPA
jgi:uncharacterized membrane protein YhaH (DUF805 family)